MESKASLEEGDAASVLAEILRLGDEWAEAEKCNDLAYLEALLADKWHFTSTRGLVVSKAQWLARPRTFPSSVKFERSDVQVHLFGTMAVLTGTAEIESARGAGVFRYADVFFLDSGKWRVAYSHFTPISE